MKNTWKRTLSALLTIAMIATLLVVPASADYTDNTKTKFVQKYNSSDAIPIEDNKAEGDVFTVSAYASQTGKGTLKKEDAPGLDADVSQGAQVNGQTHYIHSPGSGQVKIYTLPSHIDKARGLTVKKGSTSVDLYFSANPITFDVEQGDYTMEKKGSQNSIAFAVWKGGNKITAATANGKVSFTVDGEDFHVAAENEEVTVVTEADSGYKLADNGIAVAPTAGGDAIAVTDNRFTMPNEAVTVTVTFELDADQKPATGVTLTPETVELKVGGTQTLTAAKEPTDASDELAVVSGNEKVATWANDTVTAEAIGQTTITATAGTKSATAAVKVTGADQTGSTYTFESKNMAEAGAGTFADKTELTYDNKFTVLWGSSTKIDSSEKTWDDEYTSKVRLNSGGKAAKDDYGVKFTTAKAADVKVWWAESGTDNRQMTILDSTGTAVDTTSGTYGQNNPYISTLAVPAAGTYVLGGASNGNYIFKVEVTEKDTTSSTEVADDAVATIVAAIGEGATAEAANFEASKGSLDTSDADALKAFVKTALEAKLGDDADKVTVTVNTATYTAADAAAASLLAAEEKVGEIAYTATVANKADPTDTATIAGTIAVMDAGEEPNPPAGDTIAAGNYNFRQKTTTPDASVMNVQGLTWTGIAYNADANNNGEGPNGAANSTLKVKTGTDKFYTLTLTTCQWGKGEAVTTTGSWDSSTGADGADPVLTLYNVQGEVTFTFGSTVYVHSLKVEEKDAAVTTYTVSAATVDNGKVTVNPAGKVPAGTKITVTTTNDPNYVLTEGSVKYNNTTAITGGSFTMPAVDVEVTAAFEPDVTPVEPLGAVTLDLCNCNETTSAGYTNYQNRALDWGTGWATNNAHGPAHSDTDGTVALLLAAPAAGKVIKLTVETCKWNNDSNETVTADKGTKSLMGAVTSDYIGSKTDGSYKTVFDNIEVTGESETVTLTIKAGTFFHGFKVEHVDPAPSTKTITFDVPAGVTVTDVKIGETAATLEDNKLTDVAANAVVTFKLTVDEAYKLGAVTGATLADGVYTVTADSVSIAATAKVNLAGKSVTVKKGAEALAAAPVVDDVLSASVDAAIDSDLVFTWTVGDKTVTGATYTVIADDMGKTITVSAAVKADKAGDYTGAITPSAASAAVKGKTMTGVTAQGVTRSYNGQPASITVSGAPAGATIVYKTDGEYAATNPTVTNAGPAVKVYYKVSAAGYEDFEGDADITINKAAAPSITIKASINEVPAEGKTVNFTVANVPVGTAAPTLQCTVEQTPITLTKQADGTTYTGSYEIQAASEAKTHNVVLTWNDTNYQDIPETKVVIEQLEPGAVVAEGAEGLKVLDTVNYAALGITSAVDAAHHAVTYTIDTTALKAAWADADKKAILSGDGVYNAKLGRAFLCFMFEAPTGMTADWTLKQEVDGVLESTAHKLDNTDDFNVWTVDGKTVIGDWFTIAEINTTADTMTIPASQKWDNVEYYFYDASGELQAKIQLNVERVVLADKTALNATINAANTAKDVPTVSTDGKDVYPNAKWVTAAAKSAYETAIHDAQVVADKATATQAEVDAAVDALATATTAFTNAQADGTKVDTFTVTVTGGTADKATAAAGDSVTVTATVPSGKKFKAWTADGVTLDDTQKAANPVTFTMPAAAVTLTASFEDEGGTTEDANIFDPTKLTTTEDKVAVTEAEVKAPFGATDMIKRSNSATPTAVYAIETKGATEGAFTVTVPAGKVGKVVITVASNGGTNTTKFQMTDAAGAAVANKEGISSITGAADSKTALTYENLAAGTYTLAPTSDSPKAMRIYYATAEFTDAGSAPETVDKAALEAAIAAAEADVADIVPNDAAEADVPEGTEYYTTEALNAYKTAIQTAKDAMAAADTQAKADAALEALNTAKGTFEAAKKTGTKVATKADLDAAVQAAEDAKKDIEISTDGSDVSKSSEWVTQDVMDALDAAIATAKEVADDADADTLKAAIVALNEAVATFNAAKADGTKSSGGYRPGGAYNPVTPPKSETVTKEDGSTVTTTTDSKGVTTVETKRPDGSTTTAVTDAQGDVTITTTDAEGETLAEVKIPATIPSVGYKFVDVPDGHWAAKAINEMAGLGLVKGVDETQHIFDMNSDVTRGAVATMLYRFSNGKAGLPQNFSDVVGTWCADAVAWANNAGVVKGYTDGSFQPDGSVTREQLAVMIARYAKLVGMDVSGQGDLTSFTDFAKVQSWATDGVAWCVKNGIINGRGDGTIDPATPATRAEAAAMLDRFVSLIK